MNNEAEFLREQATIAKIRLRVHASALGDEVLAPLQLGPFVRRRPWWSLGGAVLGGFLSGLGLRSLRRTGRKAQAAGGMRRLAAGAGRRANRLLRTAVGTILVANLREMARPPAPKTANGHPSPSPPPPPPAAPPTSPAS